MENTASFTADANCQDGSDTGFISLSEALLQVKAEIQPTDHTEVVDLSAALNRNLAQDIYSSIDVPPHANSAMDGYAVAAAKNDAATQQSFKPIGVALAGTPYQGKLTTGECIRITTGAWIPDGATAVIIQEQCETSEQQITHHGNIETGQNIRLAGEDLKSGQLVLAQGTRLLPAQLGLLASIGCYEIPVKLTPKVAYISTGDELRGAGQSLDTGSIYDSNRYTVDGMLSRLGIAAHHLGTLKDDALSIEKNLARAFSNHDIVITSGGVSVGEADYIKTALAKLGDTKYWKVAVRPGRPFTFASIGKKLFFGLPGNPVAVMVMFYQIIQPALKHWLGEAPQPPLLLNATCTTKLKKRPGRMEFQRGIYQSNSDGSIHVSKTGMQGSGILSSMTSGNCFIVLNAEQSTINPGDSVKIQPFSDLM